MISKTSFFNKGIYKSTVKRFAWGSVLYFAMLFISTSLAMFLNTPRNFEHIPYDHYQNNPLILRSSYFTAPILMSIVVPTVVALFVFRFIHSKNQSVFTHSLPVSRKANFISSILASFTLMFAPVIVNGIILMLMSVFGFSQYFTVYDCAVWMGYNMLGLFMMFAVAVLASCLTGNSFAMVGINILIHAFIFIIISTLEIMVDSFVYGYNNMNNVLDIIASTNFATVVISFENSNFRNNITALYVCKYIGYSLLLYVISYLLYKKRRLETATDVAGYKCLNHIFKYLVCFMATMLGFAVFATYLGNNNIVFAVIIGIISLISYVASEMVLKKTFNVLYAWKGYVGFAVFFVILTTIFSGTTFFGYETRIPDKNDIEATSVYSYYYGTDQPFTEDGEIIDMALSTHKDFVLESPIPTVNHMERHMGKPITRLHINYELKNGKELLRTYDLTESEANDIMDKFYENEDYKKKCESIFVKENDITRATLNHNDSIDVEDYKTLLKLVQEDVLSLRYSQLHPQSYEDYEILYSIRFEYVDDIEPIYHNGLAVSRVNAVYVSVTPNYTNTIKYLEENGYTKLNETQVK